MASFRLNKVAKDFNVGIQTLVEYLAKKGHQVEQSPNTKISEEQYELLATAFDSERKVKEEADKIELMTTGGNRVVELSAKAEPEAEPEEVVIKSYATHKNTAVKAEPKVEVAPAPEPEPEPEPAPVAEPEPEPEPEPVTPVLEEEPAGEEPMAEEADDSADDDAPVAGDSPFKVVGTVDLSAINQRMRPDKKKRKKGEKREPAISPAAAAKPTSVKAEAPKTDTKPAPEPVVAETPKPVEPAKPAPEFIETQYTKLEGPKVLDKIDLTQFKKDGADTPGSKRKRKHTKKEAVSASEVKKIGAEVAKKESKEKEKAKKESQRLAAQQQQAAGGKKKKKKEEKKPVEIDDNEIE